MQQILGRGGLSMVSLVQLPGEGVARNSCPQNPDNQRRITLEHHLLEAARNDCVANVLWALSPQTQIDAQQRVSPLTRRWRIGSPWGSIFRIIR